MKKKIIIFISIIFVAIITVIVLINNTIKPKVTSKELFVKTNSDLIDFSYKLSNSMTNMADIMNNELYTICNFETNTIDLTKSNKFKDVKSGIITNCDNIINYNVKGLSTEMVNYIEYAKNTAIQTKEYFNSIDKEMSQDEYTKLLNQFSSNFSSSMSELTNLNNIACLSYYNEFAEDEKTIKEFKNDILDSREKNADKISKDNTSNKDKSFSNKYGTSKTICSYSGCSNYITSTGDSSCCSIHSRKCGNCGKFIDSDALYCLDCLEKAINNLK